MSGDAPEDRTGNSAEHYFVEQPDVRSEPRQIQAQVRWQKLVFTTDRGVFSREKVDRGSRMLIETAQASEGDEILDLGCGWGLMGIVAARTWPDAKVTMVDLNERACDLARANATANDAGQVEIVCGDAVETLADRSFDAILCNPPVSAGRVAVLRLMDYAAGHLKPGGAFWMVAATRKGAKSLAKRLAERFECVEEVALGSGFRVYKATEPTQGGTEQ